MHDVTMKITVTRRYYKYAQVCMYSTRYSDRL